MFLSAKNRMQNYTFEKRQIRNAVFIPLILGILMILSFVLEKGMNWDFHVAGIYPRRFENLGGIFTIVFIHADWSHLANNVLSFIILGSFLFYFYSKIAPSILLISYLLSGIILWAIGRENWHIGASGIIYSIAFFLFFSGLIRRHIPLIAISLVVAFLYGSMVWHIFPWQTQDPVSWEGHLAGGITGTLLAFIYRNKEPYKPIETWDETDDQTEEDQYLETNNDEII